MLINFTESRHQKITINNFAQLVNLQHGPACQTSATIEYHPSQEFSELVALEPPIHIQYLIHHLHLGDF